MPFLERTETGPLLAALAKPLLPLALLAALLVVVPRYGATGAAWTWCSSAGLSAAAGALLLRRCKYTVKV
jgi:O-antigen/teichoic acid export membrane protein